MTNKVHNQEYQAQQSLSFKMSTVNAVEFQVVGKVVIVTGGASGVGAGIVKEFLAKGAKHVAFWDIDEANGKERENELKAKFGDDKVEFYKCDISEDDEVNSAFDAVVKKHEYIDLVINNAGIMNDALFKKEVQINFLATVTISVRALKHMRVDEGGRGGTILNISSVTGLRQSPVLPVYYATKIAVIQFSNCLGLVENFSVTGVRVITVALGGTNTGLITEAKLGYLDDNMRAMSLNLISKIPIQSIKSAVRGVLAAYQHGESGSTWLAAHDEPPVDYTPRVKAAFKCLFSYENIENIN